MPVNLSPGGVAAVRARVAAVSSWSRGDDAVLADLAADAAANPAVQAQVPKTFELADITNAVDLSRRPNLRPYLTSAAAYIVAQDRNRILAGLRGAVSLGDIEQADYDAVSTALGATEPDPAYRASLPRIDLDLGRPCTLSDVAQSREQP